MLAFTEPSANVLEVVYTHQSASRAFVDDFLQLAQHNGWIHWHGRNEHMMGARRADAVRHMLAYAGSHPYVHSGVSSSHLA